MTTKRRWDHSKFTKFKVMLTHEEADRLRNTIHALSVPPLSPHGAKMQQSLAFQTAVSEWCASMEEVHNKGKPFPQRPEGEGEG